MASVVANRCKEIESVVFNEFEQFLKEELYIEIKSINELPTLTT